MPILILASGSPRRIEMMSRITDDFEISVPDIDETPIDGEHPMDMVLRLAAEKAGAVYENKGKKLPVLAADTIVVIDDRILGKPETTEEAEKMLGGLSGRCHKVITGVALIEGYTGKLHTFTETTEVLFGNLSENEITDYIGTGEPMDKAGAYGIQGDGGKFIKRIDGCFYNVMGFPLNSIYSLLKQTGII